MAWARPVASAPVATSWARAAAARAVADAAGSAVIYAGKTVINTVDAITPDVVNKKK